MPGRHGFQSQPLQDELYAESGQCLDDFSRCLLDSLCCHHGKSCYTTDEIISWLTELKTKYSIVVERIPLKSLKQWRWTDREISHEAHPFFSVIAVSVEAGTREVSSWTQPLLKEPQQGLLGLATKKINGVLHVLMQAKVEPGNMDSIEIAPTVSCAAVEFKSRQSYCIPFLDCFIKASPLHIRYDVVQSEEGGRFYHFCNRNMVI
jgi:oxidase EvaA